MFFFFLSKFLLAGNPLGIFYQDTIPIDTSQYIRNDPDFNLIIATYNGYSSEVLRLLNMGADVNTRTFDGITPLMYAVENNDLTTTRILVLNGADVNLKPYDGVSAIIAASRYNLIEIVDLLIRFGAKVDDTNEEGSTPLLYGAGYYYYDLCELLLRNGANPAIEDGNGTVPVMAATYGGNPDIIDLLLRYGANINARDSKGTTSLMIAAQAGDTAMIRILNGYKADLNQVNNKGFSALDIAIINGHSAAAELIISLGVNAEGKNRKNAHSLAIQYGHQKLAKKLIELGYTPNRLPSFNEIFIFAGINTSFNDLLGGGELGIRDPKYKLNIYGGYQVRLFAIRILKEESEDTYVQLWENRSLAYLGLSKEFVLTRLQNQSEFGISGGVLGGYSFGRNYRGSEKRPAELWKIIPTAGIFLGGDRFRLELHYEYLNLDTYKVSSHRVILGVKYRLTLKGNRYEEKYIHWY